MHAHFSNIVVHDHCNIIVIRDHFNTILVRDHFNIKVVIGHFSNIVVHDLFMFQGRIPVKWLAPESLYAQIYTTRSDM